MKNRWTPMAKAKSDNHVVKMMATTLSAFADIVASKDPALNFDPTFKRPFTVAAMDHTWTAVPVNGYILGSGHFLEYLLAFLPTSFWACRMTVSWQCRHENYAVEDFDYQTWFSGIPCAHTVYVPGHLHLMLVMVEDSAAASSQVIQVGTKSVKIYEDEKKRHTAPSAFTDVFVVDVSDQLQALCTDEKYLGACENMKNMIQWMDTVMSADGDMRMAVSLAAELSACAPASPCVQYNTEERTYDNEVDGAWMMGRQGMGTQKKKRGRRKEEES